MAVSSIFRDAGVLHGRRVAYEQFNATGELECDWLMIQVKLHLQSQGAINRWQGMCKRRRTSNYDCVTTQVGYCSLPRGPIKFMAATLQRHYSKKCPKSTCFEETGNSR